MEETVKQLLANACGSPQALSPGVDLIETGLLDSLAMITFLTDLEEYGIEIQPTQVNPSQFRTLEGILALVKQYQNGI